MVRVCSACVNKQISERGLVHGAVPGTCVVVDILSFWSSKTSLDYAVRNVGRRGYDSIASQNEITMWLGGVENVLDS